MELDGSLMLSYRITQNLCKNLLHSVALIEKLFTVYMDDIENEIALVTNYPHEKFTIVSISWPMCNLFVRVWIQTAKCEVLTPNMENFYSLFEYESTEINDIVIRDIERIKKNLL